MASREISSPVRYSILLVSCALLALFPWVLSGLSNPLPFDLQSTGTILAITRTARLDPKLAGRLEQALGFTATPSGTPTYTITPTLTNSLTPTASETPQPTATPTSTRTSTPLPDVRGTVSAKVNTYTCPGSGFKKGGLEFGATFHVLGWDQTVEDGEVVTWILIDDDINQPQRWVRESEYLTLSHPDYMDFIPRVACRSVP